MAEIEHDGERFTLDGEPLSPGETLCLRSLGGAWLRGPLVGEPTPDDPENAAEGGTSHLLLLLEGASDFVFVPIEAGLVAWRPARADAAE